MKAIDSGNDGTGEGGTGGTSGTPGVTPTPVPATKDNFMKIAALVIVAIAVAIYFFYK